MSLYRRFVSAAKRAGLPVLRFHDLRHLFGTQAIRAFNGPADDGPPPHHDDGALPALLADPDGAAKLSGLWHSDGATGNVVPISAAAA